MSPPPVRRPRPRVVEPSIVVDEETLLQGPVHIVMTRNQQTGGRAVELRCRRVERVTRIAIFPHQLTAVLDALEQAEDELLGSAGAAGGE